MKRVLLLLLVLVACSKGYEDTSPNQQDAYQPPPARLYATFEEQWVSSHTFDNTSSGGACYNCYNTNENFSWYNNYNLETDEISETSRFPVFEGYHFSIDTLRVDVSEQIWLSSSSQSICTLCNTQTYRPQINSFFWELEYFHYAENYDYPRYIGHIEFIGFDENSRLGWSISNDPLWNPSWENIKYFSSNKDDDYINLISTTTFNDAFTGAGSQELAIFERDSRDINEVKEFYTYDYENNTDNRLKYAIGTEHRFNQRLYVVKSVEIK